MRRYAPAVVCLVVLLVSYGHTQQCGGSERWAVKDGTDNTANQIDLSHVQETTIQRLINDIHQPKLPHDDTTRVIPDETKVVHFTARLVQWKHEVDDDDYHLVLTDYSLRFTPHEVHQPAPASLGRFQILIACRGRRETLGITLLS